MQLIADLSYTARQSVGWSHKLIWTAELFSFSLFFLSFPSLGEFLLPFIWLNKVLKQMWLPSQGQFSYVICLKNGGLGFILQGEQPWDTKGFTLQLLLPIWMDNASCNTLLLRAVGMLETLVWHLPGRGWILLKVNEILCIVQCNHCSEQQAAQHKRRGIIYPYTIYLQSCSLIAALCVKKISPELPRTDNSATLINEWRLQFQVSLNLLDCLSPHEGEGVILQ